MSTELLIQLLRDAQILLPETPCACEPGDEGEPPFTCGRCRLIDRIDEVLHAPAPAASPAAND